MAACAGYALPKIYRKVYYCISAAIHKKVVRVRSVRDRRVREPPKRNFGPPQPREGAPGGAGGAGGPGDARVQPRTALA